MVVRVYGKDLEVLGAKAAEVSRPSSTIDGVVDPRVERQPASPTLEIEVDLERGRARRGQAGRRAPHGGDPRAGHRGRQPLRGAEGVRGHRRRRARRAARASTSVGNLLVDTPSGGRSASATSPTSASRRRRRHRAEAASRAHRRRRRRRRARPRRRGRATSRSASSGIEFPLEYHTEVLGESSERAGCERALRRRSRSRR